MSKDRDKIKIGLSVGDLNGIGLEVILKSLSDNRILEMCTPIIYSSPKAINFYRKTLDLQNFNYISVSSVNKSISNKVNLIPTWEEEIKIEPGTVNKELGTYAFQSLQAAVKDLQANKLDALVTAPINKKTIQSDDFDFPGHTEYLQEQAKADDSLMFMISNFAKIGVVTGHIPLKEVPKKLSTDAIFKKIMLMNRSLKEDFGINKPKIAVLGLNPHAGDNGLLGSEEKDTIKPAILQAKNIGILAFGPYPADGFFGSGNFSNFDGVLAMYHDQGLIPAKSLSFGNGVNFTAGLSFIRTSPDHGTAYDIAGKNLADGSSFRNAIYQAIDISSKRQKYNQLTQNVLSISKNRK